MKSQYITYVFLPLVSLFFALTTFALPDTLNEGMVASGSLNELNRAFVLLSKSDGHVAEELDILIGKSITANPVNFLKAYKNNKSSIVRLDALVGNLGPEFVDDFSRQAEEIRKRIKVLEAVKTRQLKPFALDCIKELKKKLAVVDR